MMQSTLINQAVIQYARNKTETGHDVKVKKSVAGCKAET